jgi:hypothetical protein
LTLQEHDLPYLYSGGVGGSIIFNPTKFTVNPPKYFHAQLEDLLETGTRNKGANVRLLIGHYLVHAVKLAKAQFDLPTLTFHSKLGVSPEIVPGVGILSGDLDFVCATIKGE